jgi:beta-glucosidase
MNFDDTDVLSRKKFGKKFKWGVSTAAYQIEGAHDADGKGLSIWDVFCNTGGKIFSGHKGETACDFYNRYEEDILLLKELEIPNFRFSLSWPRILPEGTGAINQKGIDFYNKIIDTCLNNNIEPWITLYHWDLPYALELKGGWTNREIISWFEEYVTVCAKHFGDRVKYWMVLNEPMAFAGAGHFLGIHAPGKTGLKNLLPAIHHAVLCMGAGGRILKAMLPNAEVGTTFSFSYIEPASMKPKDIAAAKRVDTLLNRMFIEPVLGMGYPEKDLPVLRKLKKYFEPGDEDMTRFDFDFIGLQNYTREIVKYSMFIPYLNASVVNAKFRKVPLTAMEWEVYPPSLYYVLKKVSAYEGVKKIYVTENGAAFDDIPENGSIRDMQRTDYIQEHLKEVLRAKNEGVKVEGYFVWTLLDNFEWAEGYRTRFGLVHVDFDSQQRTIKSSGYWYRDFLKE